jgi:hypothetical protein
MLGERAGMGRILLGLVMVPVVASCADVIGLASVQRVDCVVDCNETDATFLDATGDAPGRTSRDATRDVRTGPSPDGGHRGDGGTSADTGPPPCSSDSDCTTQADPRCDVSTGACVPCLLQNDNCPHGEFCNASGTTFTCTTGCDLASQCGPDGGTDGGGAWACCSNACVNTGDNTGNCGMCGEVCSSENITTVACAAGVCSGACNTGYADCNSNKQTDGCETDVAGTDVMNCGGCGTTCSTANITATCTGGVCDGACTAGYADCNSNKQTDGCETDIETSSTSCGACGTACSASHMATVTCGAGMCNGTCAAGYADCNANKETDGCETAIETNVSDCGSCGHVCPAGDTCVAGVCNGCLAGGKSPPAPCTTGVDGSSGSPWVVCTSSCTAAWLSEDNGQVSNEYNALTICNGLGYGAVNGYAGTCGYTCGTCEATTTSCTVLGTPSFSTPITAEPIGYWVEWQCVP